MQHVEFVHIDHFENNYHRTPPPKSLAQFIDFFWETKFDHLWGPFPNGFSDAQFPNIGYTYIINLGTDFIMQVDDKKFPVKTDCFLPRYNAIECFHKPGNHLFGVKFRISPIVFQKKINFSEYKQYLFPLSYLIEPDIIEKVKSAGSFEERKDILSKYFNDLLRKHHRPIPAINLVSRILVEINRTNDFNLSLEEFAVSNKISLRTLQRYFERYTGISSKKAMQIMRIRKALAHLITSPQDFHFSKYGYYDQSHFARHLQRFSLRNTAGYALPTAVRNWINLHD